MKKIIIFVVFIFVIGIGLLISNRSDQNPSSSQNVNQTQTTERMPEGSGLHIMADGTVMDGMGKPVMNATIQSDGNIRLEDGRILIPMMDMRK